MPIRKQLMLALLTTKLTPNAIYRSGTLATTGQLKKTKLKLVLSLKQC